MAPAGHQQNGLCPCCNDTLQKIKSGLQEISRLLAEPLPPQISEDLDAFLSDIRKEGRSMLTQLGQCLRVGEIPSIPLEFEASVKRFSGEIDRLTREGRTRGIGETGVYRIYALCLAFIGIAASVRDLVDEFSLRPPDQQN